MFFPWICKSSTLYFLRILYIRNTLFLTHALCYTMYIFVSYVNNSYARGIFYQYTQIGQICGQTRNTTPVSLILALFEQDHTVHWFAMYCNNLETSYIKVLFYAEDILDETKPVKEFSATRKFKVYKSRQGNRFWTNNERKLMY